jgi:hypothetical protein
MKTIYEFAVNKEGIVKETEESVNEAGQKVTITKDVVTQIPHNYFIKKPTRALFDEAELFYGVKLSEGVKAGLLTRTLLNKRYVDDGGILADKTKSAEADAYKDLYDTQNELQRLVALEEKDRPEYFVTKKEELETKITVIKSSLTELEMQKESLFDNTAETRARNKVITWWILFLSYYEKNGEKLPFFGEGDYEARMNRYDEIFESEDPHLTKAANAFIYFISFWYVGRANTREDFDLLKLEQKIF